MEVLISALIVGLIVVGTFTGIDVAQSTGISERDHNEAILLSSESQESLRSAPASTFDSSTGVWEHAYTKSINGESYSVTQKASFLNSGGEAAACSATNTTRQETNSLRLTSVVSWPQQEAQEHAHGNDPPVTVSSVTTPPAASALEVDVGNYPTPTAGVAGVPVTIKYIANGSGTEESLSGTTGSPGCVVFSAVPASSALVEIGEKAGYVDPSGSSKWQTKEVTIAPNHTTHYPVTLNEGGAIKAELLFKNSPGLDTIRERVTGSATLKEPVTVDTVVAANQLMESSPNFELGSAKAGTWSAGTYTPVFGTTTTASSTTANETWATSITTPIETAGTKYPNGNLFPFPAPGAWDVYAGACTANNPHTLNAAIGESTLDVTGGTTQPVKVPVSYVKLNVYTSAKTSSTPTFDEATAYPVTITNTACKSLTPDNESAINEPKETEYVTVDNSTNSTSWPLYGGHLEHPFLPFGAGRLCLAYNSGSKHDTFTTTYELTAEGEYIRNIYIPDALEYSSSRGHINTATDTEPVPKPPSGTEEPTVTIESSSGEAKCK